MPDIGVEAETSTIGTSSTRKIWYKQILHERLSSAKIAEFQEKRGIPAHRTAFIRYA
jgi:hypothetical protein